MKIVLSGVENFNKGAELMFYAILQEIEREFPGADVYVEDWAVPHGLGYMKTTLTLKTKPYVAIKKILDKIHLPGLLKRLHIEYLEDVFSDIYAIKGSTYFLDASGFHFSDQIHWDDIYMRRKKKLWRAQKKAGSKLVFLPQAFGPFTRDYAKRYLQNMIEEAALIMPREQTSLKHLRETGIVDMTKVQEFGDFTSLVKGYFPTKYNHLKGAVCIIPNRRMVDSGTISLTEYVHFLTEIIEDIKKRKVNVYILNHAHVADEQLAYECQKATENKIEVVSGLNALEIKGLISESYLVITSRFHGAVSALNSCVPCLATSWSHKYAELFKDYDLDNCILPISDIQASIDLVQRFLDVEFHQQIHSQLSRVNLVMKRNAQDMWKSVWN